MDEVRYKVVFNGMVMMETPEETVKANMARLFKCDLARVEPLFSGEPATLKRHLNEQEANHYVQVLRNAGAIVHKEREQVVKPVAAPVALELAEKPEPVKPVDASITSPAASAATLTANASTDPFGGPAVRAQPRAQEQRPVYKSPSQELAARQEEVYCELNFISLQGRLGRLRYLAWGLAMILLMIPISVVVGIGAAIALTSPVLKYLIMAAIVGVVIAFVAFLITLMARRLHDVNLSAWWILAPLLLTVLALMSPRLFIIPAVVVNYFLFPLFLSVKAGSDGDNDFGPPPPPNSTGVIILASVYIVFHVIGLLGFLLNDGFTQLQRAVSLYSAAKEGDNDEVMRQMDEQIEEQMKRDPEFRRRMENDPEFRKQIEQMREQMRKQRGSRQ